MVFKTQSIAVQWRNSNGLNFRGLVTLKKSLNYEERSSYNLVVEAQDAGDNILSSTASIFVQVSGGDHMDQRMVVVNGR